LKFYEPIPDQTREAKVSCSNGRAHFWEFVNVQIAAFIAEPLMGAGGVIPPPATYWDKVSLRSSNNVFHNESNVNWGPAS
jgi:adenosylmethionine-8-amino-7-oxononanoate aminotransferase